MAKIKKLKNTETEDNTIYPMTIPQAVVDPETQKTLPTMLSELKSSIPTSLEDFGESEMYPRYLTIWTDVDLYGLAVGDIICEESQGIFDNEFSTAVNDNQYKIQIGGYGADDSSILIPITNPIEDHLGGYTFDFIYDGQIATCYYDSFYGKISVLKVTILHNSATTDYVDTAISNAITTTLNTDV